MSVDPLLAIANERRKGEPGRPPLSDEERAKRKATHDARRSAQLAAVAPRLFDVTGAARYLSCSPWTIRDMIANGTLQRVVIPTANGRDLRRVLLDRAQLDELVMKWRESGR